MMYDWETCCMALLPANCDPEWDLLLYQSFPFSIPIWNLEGSKQLSLNAFTECIQWKLLCKLRNHKPDHNGCLHNMSVWHVLSTWSKLKGQYPPTCRGKTCRLLFRKNVNFFEQEMIQCIFIFDLSSTHSTIPSWYQRFQHSKVSTLKGHFMDITYINLLPLPFFLPPPSTPSPSLPPPAPSYIDRNDLNKRLLSLFEVQCASKRDSLGNGDRDQN